VATSKWWPFWITKITPNCFADGDGVWEDFFELVGKRVGDDVKILGVKAEQHVADAAAGEIGGVAGFLESADEVDGGEAHGEVGYRSL